MLSWDYDVERHCKGYSFLSLLAPSYYGFASNDDGDIEVQHIKAVAFAIIRL